VNASDNTALGDFAGGWFGAGTSNVFLGRSAGEGDTDWSGSNNIFIGRDNATNLNGASSDNNIVLGSNAAPTLISGDSNIIIGVNTDVTSSTASNELNIGNLIRGDLANTEVQLSNDISTPIPSTHTAGEGILTIAGANRDVFHYSIIADDGSGPDYTFRRTGVGEIVVDDGDKLGGIRFEGFDGTRFRRGAEITAEVEGTPSGGQVPTDLIFRTTPTNNPIERMHLQLTLLLF